MSKSKQIIKEGDIVVCINPADNIYIEQGREYEVLRVCENAVVLNISIGNVRYPVNLFELKANTEVFKANTEVFKTNKADKQDDNNLEYQVKVLEENAMLRSLLRKHGAFV